MPDQIPKTVVQERFDRLVELQEQISLERSAELIGRTVEVLTEGRSKKDAARITARTRTNKIVHVSGNDLSAGRFMDARITGAHPHYLDGVPV